MTRKDAMSTGRAGAASSKAPTELDIFACPLDGTQLIEASAGTGKTWNICALYLRLLLERRLDVQRILVVTFTNAATAELRERIRSRLVEMLAFLRGGTLEAPPVDRFVPELLKVVTKRTGASVEALATLLDQALQHFDEAAIFTIHGFCQRALGDAAWSAGMPLALEFASDDSELIGEAVRDFWRRRLAAPEVPRPVAAHLHAKKDTPEKYRLIVKRALTKPLARNLWPDNVAAATVLDTGDLDTAYDTARRLWLAAGDELRQGLLAARDKLHKGHYKEDAIERAAAAWDAYLQSSTPLAQLPKNVSFNLFGRRRLSGGKGGPPPIAHHPFFAAADALLDARDALTAQLDLARLRLLRELVESVPEDVRRRKRERRAIAFDDMLYNLYAALEHGEHPDLARTLLERYPVALIDEFQDTDPLQFAIFRQIYPQHAATMFLVGDPKQAIYSFRNADLHAYLRARQGVDRSWTLAHNQRSTPALIGALNGLFAQNPQAFVLSGLIYPQAAIGERRRVRFRDDSESRCDFEVWMLPSKDAGAIEKYAASREAVTATAAEIARLVAAGERGQTSIGERALRASDIAVLVRTHAQGTEIKHALADLGVGSVELAQASVFRSIDAEEVERVMQAIANPSHPALLRGALATEMLGCSAADVLAIGADEARLGARMEQFAGYRDLWLRRGVGVMYRRMLREAAVSARLLARPDGERRLTNLLHLGELIHQAAATHDSPDALLRWLATQRREDSRDEAAQLRLESDQNLVQIVTIHRAKGLEFPIVFCPFAWDGFLTRSLREADARQYHDDEGHAVIDFRLLDDRDPEKVATDKAHRRENAAERVRLLYVAMTRAIHRCYVIAGNYVTNGARGSPKESNRGMLNWLVAGAGHAPEEWLDDERPKASAITAAWEAYAERHAGVVALRMVPFAAGPAAAAPRSAAGTYAALAPPRAIPPAWRYASFSGMIGDAQADLAASDHDAHVTAPATTIGAPPLALAPDDILRFPRGPRAGDCLHAVFERIDFTDRTGWNDAIGRALALHPQAGTSAGALAPMALRMLDEVLATPLTDGLVLGTIPRTRRLVELEFDLPMPHLASRELNAALAALGYRVPRLGFRDLAGYLKGFIDLVVEHGGRYYVIDWKSNHLGYEASHYDARNVAAAMAEHGYHLQYLLYTLAVDRYLRHRLPGYRYETHFGGALYLFVRGVRPDWRNADGTPAGVHFDRPSRATIERLDALIGLGTPETAR